ncbi:MAG: TIGR02266 family protein [Polyangia bacterium]
MPTPTSKVEDERRLQPRFAVAVKVTMDSEHNFYTGLTQDLSGGGLFVATHHIRPIGEVVRVNFTLPALRDPIEALTQVRWVRSSDVGGGGGGPGMGLMFIELSAKAKEAIKGFLRQRDSLLFDVD